MHLLINDYHNVYTTYVSSSFDTSIPDINIIVYIFSALFHRDCQTKDWSEHKYKCKVNASVPVAFPFVISLPASQATYDNLGHLTESFARYNYNSSLFKHGLLIMSVVFSVL